MANFIDTPPSAFIDVSKMRLGDRMACAWWAQARRINEGLRFALLDANFMLAERFSLSRFFPATFTEIDHEQIQALGLPEWHQSNLWLTVTNAFAKTQLAGHFEYLPPEVLERSKRLAEQKQPGRPRILIHQLNDAPYNRVRNWKQCDADALPPALQSLGFDVHLLNPKAGSFAGGYAEMLAQMLACEAFIGGDTGPSHVFALLCADKPQLTIYPDMTRNEKMYEWQRNELGLELPWSSMPLRADLAKLTLRHSRHWVFERGLPRWHRVGRFEAKDAIDSLLRVMPLPKPPSRF